MAQLALTVANAHVQRIVAAFRATVSLPDSDGLSNDEFIRQALLRYVRDVVRDYERRERIRAAEQAAIDEVTVG